MQGEKYRARYINSASRSREKKPSTEGNENLGSRERIGFNRDTQITACGYIVQTFAWFASDFPDQRCVFSPACTTL